LIRGFFGVKPMPILGIVDQTNKELKIVTFCLDHFWFGFFRIAAGKLREEEKSR